MHPLEEEETRSKKKKKKKGRENRNEHLAEHIDDERGFLYSQKNRCLLPPRRRGKRGQRKKRKTKQTQTYALLKPVAVAVPLTTVSTVRHSSFGNCVNGPFQHPPCQVECASRLERFTRAFNHNVARALAHLSNFVSANPEFTLKDFKRAPYSGKQIERAIERANERERERMLLTILFSTFCFYISLRNLLLLTSVCQLFLFCVFVCV